MEQNNLIKVRKRRQSRKGLAVILVAIAMVCIPALFVLVMQSSRPKVAIVTNKSRPAVAPVEEIEEPETASSEIRGKWHGLCGKGVVRNVSDFRRVVENDPVLTSHFEDFDWDNAKQGTLENAVWTPVAYRSGDVIRMTKKRVLLPKGDGFITDGTRRVRTYCCNDYSESAPPPQVLAPPTEENVDSAVPRPKGAEPPREVVAGPPLQKSAGSPSQGSAGPPPRVALAKPLAVYPPKRNPPTPVPEPGTILLFGTGAGLFGLYRLFGRRNK